MIDYRFKAMVMTDHQDMLKLQRAWSRLSYLRSHTDLHIDEDYQEAIRDAVSFFVSSDNDYRIWRECERINEAYYARVKRLKNRIGSMLCSGDCYFLTLTFTDEVLCSTSANTRRRYVTRLLSSYSDYVANIDFGSLNGREHYHAVVKSPSLDLSLWDCYGFSNAKKIASVDDFSALAKYISKLTNHAIKDTTQGSRIIYSR